jgi:hypothetical protein
LVVAVVSVLGVGSGVEDEGVVDAFLWRAGAWAEGCGEFGFGYDIKTEPSFEDMLTKLRKTLIAARFRRFAQVTPTLIYCVTTPWPAPPPRRRETRDRPHRFKKR